MGKKLKLLNVAWWFQLLFYTALGIDPTTALKGKYIHVCQTGLYFKLDIPYRSIFLTKYQLHIYISKG